MEKMPLIQLYLLGIQSSQKKIFTDSFSLPSLFAGMLFSALLFFLLPCSKITNFKSFKKNYTKNYNKIINNNNLIGY